MLAVTFTNKAAEEMRARVEALLGSDCSRMWVSTFHSLCARLLRREAPAIGLSRDFVIYDSSDQLAVVKQALKELHIDDSFVQPRAALSRISHAKNRMEGPDAMAASAGWNRRDEQIAKVYAYYLKTLKESNALDFDDLLLKTVDLFEQSAKVRAKYAASSGSSWSTNIRTRTGRSTCSFAGSPRSIATSASSAIRTSRSTNGAAPTSGTSSTSSRISAKRRSSSSSATTARRRSSSTPRRPSSARTATARTSTCGPTARAATASRTSAAATSSRKPTSSRERRGPPLAEDVDATVAVLYRTNAQSRTIEDALMREGLAYKVVGGVRFYERKEIKDALAYMRLVINPHDDVSLRRVINVPARGIGKGVMDAVGLLPAEFGNSLWARIVRGLDERAFPSRAAASLQVFRDLIVKLTEVARQEPVSIAIGKMLDQSGYLQDLRDERSEDAEGRIENLAELVSAAREYEGRELEPSLNGFVDRLSLLSDADEEQGSQDARVWLMTLHSAKGLEFPVVVLAGLEEGLFPHSRSSEDDEELEEERRLCYVGMTRARRSWCSPARRAAASSASIKRASRRGSSTRCRPSSSIASRRRSRRATRAISRTASSARTRTAGPVAAIARAKTRPPTRTRTRISRPASPCGPACACAIRSSASAASSASRRSTTTRSWSCGSKPPAARRCARNTRGSKWRERPPPPPNVLGGRGVGGV